MLERVQETPDGATTLLQMGEAAARQVVLITWSNFLSPYPLLTPIPMLPELLAHSTNNRLIQCAVCPDILQVKYFSQDWIQQ